MQGRAQIMNKAVSHPVKLTPLFRLCNIIRWLLLAFLLVQILFFLLAWTIPMPLKLGSLHIQLDPDGLAPRLVQELSVAQKVTGVGLGLPGLVALTCGLMWLGQTLRHFQDGRIFAVDTIARLRSSAGAIFLAILLFALEKPMREIAFNLLGNGKTYPVSIDLSSSELLLILVCSLFYLVAGVMHEGRRLSEENEGFI